MSDAMCVNCTSDIAPTCSLTCARSEAFNLDLYCSSMSREKCFHSCIDNERIANTLRNSCHVDLSSNSVGPEKYVHSGIDNEQSEETLRDSCNVFE
eukprot:5851862-Karenia_brevis.AAC.1